MRSSYAAAGVLFPFILVGQVQMPGFLPADTQTVQCPWDTAQHILTYANWEAYQTLNGQWDGPRDSTICLDLAFVQGWVGPRIQLDQCDVTRPVFVRALLDSASAVPLDSNTLYVGSQDLYPSNSAILDTTGLCAGGLCTGVRLAVQVPDSMGTGHVLRWYQGGVPNTSGWYQLRTCVPTERFPSNALREYIIQLKPTGNTSGQHIDLAPPQLDDWQSMDLVRLDSTTLESYRTGPTDIELTGWGLTNFMVMYTDTTYPSPPHVGHLDVNALPNTSTPTTVTLELQPYSGLVFQPYTQFRAGTVLNSDSIRHDLVLINAGGDLCLGFEIVELIWEPGSRYVHQAGHLDFEGVRSCFLFKRGSTLEVAPGSTLHYGIGNRGMLLLNVGSNVVIGDGGELRVHGTLVLKEGGGATEPQDLHTTLGPGTTLRFAPGSRVANGGSLNGAMRWVVHSDGATVDLSGLSGADREKIVVVDLPREPLTGLTLLGGADQLVVRVASRDGASGRLRCMDALGRVVRDTPVNLSPGPNDLTLFTGGWTSGAYLVELEVGGERRLGRWVRP